MTTMLIPALLLALAVPVLAKERWYRAFGPNGNELILECKAAVQKIDDPSWQGTKQEAYSVDSVWDWCPELQKL